jgi:hypothetical protein
MREIGRWGQDIGNPSSFTQLIKLTTSILRASIIEQGPTNSASLKATSNETEAVDK